MNLIHALIWPLLCSLLLSFLFEQLLTPKPLLPWRRPITTSLIHIGTYLILFPIILLLINRPWFSITLILAFQCFVLLVNHAKYQSLREAFFYQDFEYFTDAIKNPRLYLPFFGIARSIAAIIGIVSVFYFGITLEGPLVENLLSFKILSIYSVLILSGIGLIYFNLKNIVTTDYDPNIDLQQLGQISYFWKYWIDEQQTVIDTRHSPFKNKATQQKQPRPNIVVVQSESFFDPRSYFNSINKDVLKYFDQITQESIVSGRLHVPAWEANTVRTEWGFLSGLTPEKMGVHQFNPYRFLANNKIPNLVSHLKEQGYLTICIHPYPVSFYQRDKVFPNLGFDQFIDIKDFTPQQKSGQYIGDLAVSDKINDLLDNPASQPVFIFAITMENHGPLHLEQPSKEDTQSFYTQPPPRHSEDLTVYLKHLKNADLMIDQLKQGMLNRDNKSLLCWYGDHVPIMPKVYDNMGTPDGRTDYFIWDSLEKETTSIKQEIAINDLAVLLIKNAKYE